MLKSTSPDRIQNVYYKTGVSYLVVLFFLLQLSVAFLNYNHSLTFDEAMWQYIGRNWFRNGLVPYAGGVDNKSPLIFAMFGLSDRLFGVNYWFPRLIGICFQSCGLYFVYKIAKIFSGEFAGILAITIYGFSLVWHATGGKYVSYTESYAVAFIVASVYFAARGNKNRHFFISGILAGFGFLFRLPEFFGVLAIFIFLVLNRNKSVLIFIYGLVVTVAVIFALLSFSGISLHDIFIYSIADNFGSGSVTDHSILWKSESLFNHVFYSEFVLMLPGLIGYFFIRQKNKLFVLWLVFEFTGISVIGVYSDQHLKNMLPALAIMNAGAINYVAESYRINAKKIMIIVIICFFPRIIEPLATLKKMIFTSNEKRTDYCSDLSQEPDDYSKRMMGLWVKSNTAKDDEVLVAGYGAIVQAYSERVSPCIYFNVTQTKRAKERFIDDIENSKPKMILVPQSEVYKRTVDYDIRDFIDKLTFRNYYFDKCLFGYYIYVNKTQNGN